MKIAHQCLQDKKVPVVHKVCLGKLPAKSVQHSIFESVSAAAGAVDDHIDICPHNNIDIDFILL